MKRSALLCTAVTALVVASPVAARADTAPTTLHVVGNGRVFVTPDRASVSVQTTRTATTRQQARAKVSAAAKTEVAGILAAGIPRADLQTSSISLGTTTVKHGKTKKKVYVAEIDLNVTVRQLTLLSPVFDAASRAGADSFEGPDFSFSNPSAGLIDASNAALVDARARADAAAAQLGMHVTGVQSVNLDPGSSSGPTPVYASATSTKAASAQTVKTPVLPGQQEVDASVDVVYLLGS